MKKFQENEINNSKAEISTSEKQKKMKKRIFLEPKFE
jgi:hypothetical protein